MTRQPRSGASARGDRLEGQDRQGTALGDWIRAARTEQGVSQRALADRSGLSRSYLCDIERGRGARPSVATLDKLAVALGVSRTDLLQVSGILETPAGKGGGEAERRLIAVYRDLSAGGQMMVERFARFVHSEEHRWSQPPLLEGDQDESEDLPTMQIGPALFEIETVMPADL